MNFIGHAYIARNFPQLIAGNFAGDSYKGNLDKFKHLPSHIQQGIHLHRFIDNFTDTSPFIKSVGKVFQNEGVTKVAFIASDILLDHFIIKNWTNYSNKTYAEFIQIIYNETDKNLIYLEEEFCFLYRKLKQYKWLYQYDTEEGIEMIFWQFSRRLGFKNDLLKCMDIYKREKVTIDSYFKEFMEDILLNSEQYIEELI